MSYPHERLREHGACEALRAFIIYVREQEVTATGMINFTNITLAKGIGILLVIAAVGGGTAYAGSVVSRNNIMDQRAAETFAIVDAGVDKKEVTNLHTYLERNQGKYVYDIEFHVGDTEYEYEVLAEDGTILDMKVEGDHIVSHETAETVKTASSQSGQGAGEIQGSTGLNQDTQDSKSGVSQDENSRESRDSFLQNQDGNKDDAAAGQHNNESKDSSAAGQDGSGSKDGSAAGQDGSVSAQDTSVAGQTSSPIDYIGVDRAKQIALDHAGFRENEVIFSKAKFDKEKDDNDDDGPEYEIEFYKDNMEYEYEIDALTGNINESSAEPDND